MAGDIGIYMRLIKSTKGARQLSWPGQAKREPISILSAANEQIPRLASATVRKYFFGVSGRAIRDTLQLHH